MVYHLHTRCINVEFYFLDELKNKLNFTFVIQVITPTIFYNQFI